MGEKKSLKVSLKTYLISMFLMLLVIGILLGYIMHTSKTIHAKLTSIEKHIENQNNSESVVDEKDEIIENEIEEENIVSEKDEEKLEPENTVIENNEDDVKPVEDEVEFSEKEIESVLEGYINIFRGHGSPAGMLNSLELMDWKDEEKFEKLDDGFIKTDIPYSVFEKKIEEYTTLENFKTINEGNKFVDLEFKNVDDFVAYYDSGWSGTGYEVYKIEKNENSLTATHTAEILRTDGDRKVIENIEFSVENNNGKCVISYCK